MEKHENTELNILQRKYDNYLKLKKICSKMNTDIVMQIDKTSYNSLFHIQNDIKNRIENLFIILNDLLKKKDFENYFIKKVLLFKELNKLATFLKKYKKEQILIVAYTKQKEAKVRG